MAGGRESEVAERTLTSGEVLAMLAAAPSQIVAATADLEPTQLRAVPAPGEWSANDVLAHLRACADVWGGCIATMLAQDRPTLRATSPRTWIGRTDYPEQEFRPSLHAFTVQRDELLATLCALTPEEWARTATVRGAGKTLERTVFFYAHWLAIHECPHMKQIARIARPWRSDR